MRRAIFASAKTISRAGVFLNNERKSSCFQVLLSETLKSNPAHWILDDIRASELWRVSPTQFRCRMPDMLTTSRVWLCFATALTVSATAYICAWLNYRNIESHPYIWTKTRWTLNLLHKEIEAYKEKTGDWPTKLTDLKVVQEKELPVDEAGNPVDVWGHPIQYRVVGNGFMLSSYGRDGQPGGVGVDADLYDGQPNPPLELPSFWEFTIRKESLPVQIACVLAGVFAFPLCVLQAKGKPDKQLSLVWLLPQWDY